MEYSLNQKVDYYKNLLNDKSLSENQRLYDHKFLISIEEKKYFLPEKAIFNKRNPKRKIRFLDLMLPAKEVIHKSILNSEFRNKEISYFFNLKKAWQEEEIINSRQQFIKDNDVFPNEFSYDPKHKYTVGSNDGIKFLKQLLNDKEFQKENFYKFYYQNRAEGLSHTLAAKKAKEQLRNEFKYSKSIFFDK